MIECKTDSTLTHSPDHSDFGVPRSPTQRARAVCTAPGGRGTPCHQSKSAGHVSRASFTWSRATTGLHDSGGLGCQTISKAFDLNVLSNEPILAHLHPKPLRTKGWFPNNCNCREYNFHSVKSGPRSRIVYLESSHVPRVACILQTVLIALEEKL